MQRWFFRADSGGGLPCEVGARANHMEALIFCFFCCKVEIKYYQSRPLCRGDVKLNLCESTLKKELRALQMQVFVVMELNEYICCCPSVKAQH